MSKIVNNAIIKNKGGRVRSGWLILLVMAAFYALQYIIPSIFVEVLRRILIARGDINAVTGETSALVDWMNEVFLPVFLQILMEIIAIALALVVWRLLMKHPLREMGLVSIRKGGKDGLTGILFGIVSCSLVWAVLFLSGQAYVETWEPTFHLMHFWWIITLLFVAFGEELLYRSLLMSILRRSGSLCAAALVSSAVFGSVHLMNPNVTLVSVLNIMLAGLLFSYIYIKTGNIWMCIGFHFTWNTFQGVVYGMPTSGLILPSVISTSFTADNIINGGAFGIEGGIMTTAMMLAGFLFVKYYSRNSQYDFLTNTGA